MNEENKLNHNHEHEDNNKIKLMIITSDGNYEDEFNIHQKLSHVAEMTVNKLDLIINPAEYFLYLQESTTELDMNLSIADVGLTNGSCLDYRKRNYGGGF